MQCKKALEEAQGDMAKAMVILRQKSKDIASKKGDRLLVPVRLLHMYIVQVLLGTLVELVCETDFVSKNEEFKTLARDIAMHVVASNPESLKASDISEDVKKTAVEAFKKDVEGKPGSIKSQILRWQTQSFFQRQNTFRIKILLKILRQLLQD